MFAEAMRKVPGNDHFKYGDCTQSVRPCGWLGRQTLTDFRLLFRSRIEYTSIVDYYFGRKAYIAAQIGLNGALQSLNIISVVQSAQVMDNAISAIFGQSCGFNLTPFGIDSTDGNSTLLSASTDFWSCLDTNDVTGSGNGWGCHVILSMGYIVALAITLPMGYFNLDDNMIVQVQRNGVCTQFFFAVLGICGLWGNFAQFPIASDTARHPA